MINLTAVSDKTLDDMHRAVFELCKIASDAVTANRKATADSYPSPEADKLNAAYPAIRDDLDAAYRVWDAIVAEADIRRHRQEALLKAVRLAEVTREWVADGEVIDDARGDVTWTVTGTQC